MKNSHGDKVNVLNTLITALPIAWFAMSAGAVSAECGIPGGLGTRRLADVALDGSASVPAGRMCDPYDYKKTVQRRVAPVSVVTNAVGNVLVDFGREAFGFLELLPPSGAEGGYDVRLGELLKGGSVNMKPGATIRAARVKGKIAAGGGVHRVPLVPDRRNTTGGREGGAVQIPPEHGVIMPFRYAEFAAAPFAVTKGSVRMVAVNYPMDMTASSFECDDQDLVKIYDFCKHSILATSFAGLYVDGDRERIPYEMDAYLNQLCEYAVHADYSLARASHEYLMAHPTWPTEWRQYSIRMAWADWMWSGDARSIAKFYDQLKGEKLLASHARADGLLVTGGERMKHSLTNACGLADIVDWPPCERDGFVFRDVNAVVNAFHYRNLLEMADIARSTATARGRTTPRTTQTRRRSRWALCRQSGARRWRTTASRAAWRAAPGSRSIFSRGSSR